MLTQTQLRALLDQHALSPRKALGQNFLVDANLLRKLLDASGLESGDVVLEVGPGAGSLTEPMLERGARVFAVELDDGLATLLQQRLAPAWPDAFTLIRGDCLASKRRINPEAIAAIESTGAARWKLIANLPYGAASPLMLTLLTQHPRCASMHVTIQKEVADRLMAPPGSRDYGELSVIAQAFAEIRRVATAPPECFWPRPKVTSAMISLIRRDHPLTDDAESLVACCSTLFQKRRKQLGAIIGRDVAESAGFDPTRRPESLSIEEFVQLAAALRIHRAE
ncbi:MAG: 16S rRNA (adenine(1518)-N(6)/adenine(1519)-N(6))-dimethyltransferase RsmA [Planctomycetota bacterium]|nr:16S rRNA (adenine(1518)-N(6)/adenine(1519)-N(6))-dimethyltransferase RsmA [Planctomycetota bacterium]